MPKRSAEEKIAYYKNKIKKITEKQRGRRIISESDESLEESFTSKETQYSQGEWERYPNSVADPESEAEAEPEAEAERQTEAELEAEPESVPTMSQAVRTAQTETFDANITQGEKTAAENSTSSQSELDPNILAALGEITNDTPDFGEKIHENLAKIWTPILKKGLTKENRDKLLKEFLIPENCRLLKAPALNPEILAAVADTARNRDKKIHTFQQQLGIGIAAVNRGLNLLVKNEDQLQAIKFLCDGCRILSDLHFQETEARIKYISPSLDKTFLQLVQAAERDETLFGNQLSEKIKASKAITTQSKQIKKTSSASKPSTSQSTASRSNKQGNWQGPPRYPLNRGGRGGSNRFSHRSPHQRSTRQPDSKTNASRTRGAPKN